MVGGGEGFVEGGGVLFDGDFFECGFEEGEVGGGCGEDFVLGESGDEFVGELVGVVGGCGVGGLVEVVEEIGVGFGEFGGLEVVFEGMV